MKSLGLKELFLGAVRNSYGCSPNKVLKMDSNPSIVIHAGKDPRIPKLSLWAETIC